MKKLIFLIAAVLAFGFEARASDECFDTVNSQLKAEAKKSSDWAYEGLSILKRKDAKATIESAMADDEEADKTQMLGLVNDQSVLFYILNWSAPSNSGATIIAVDKASCTTIVDVLLGSEE